MIECVIISRAQLLRSLEGGALVLTGNARLSRSLHAEYARSLLAAGREAWRTPALMPYSAWLQQAWAEAALHSERASLRLLSAEQENALWASVIGEDAETLLRPSATARAVARSWQLLHEFRLDVDDEAFAFQPDSRALRRWVRRFAAACGKHGWITAAELGERLGTLAQEGALSLPGQIILVGFYELTPLQLTLLQALRDGGVHTDWVSLSGNDSEPSRVQARDPADELDQVAGWARRHLAQSPDARLGIVVPDLAASRTPLARRLRDALDPAALGPGAAGRWQPWNFSLGEPLSADPVIQAALALLSLAERVISLEMLGAMLASPWWVMPDSPEDHAGELARRGLLDRRLRERHGQPQVGLGTLAYFAGEEDEDGMPRPWTTPRIARVLRRLRDRRQGWPARAGAADWAHHFSGWLKQAGWCAGSRLDSRAFQVVEKWQEMLATLSSLDDFESSLRPAEALSLIRRLANETVFQPRAGDAPVQVLGVLEANEQAFDALWVLGLHDGRWPQPVAPDPFIPLRLQRAHGLPGCNPAGELERARKITAQLSAAAAEVVFSYPVSEGDEQLRPSPLIQPFKQRDAAAKSAHDPPRWQAVVRASGALEALPLPVPIPFAGERAHGGTQLFKHQATCPFRAFAEHRLGARPLESAALGLDAAGRGSLMHSVLERFWRRTMSLRGLEELPGDELTARVEACVEAAIVERARPLEWQPQLSAIERQRLTGQVLRWLAMEQERAPFTVVGFEQKARLEVGGLEIEVKIDRVDQLEDGGLVIIDYKTGKVSPAHWQGERPEDPQLPLYAMHHWPAPLAGVAFGVVRADEARFRGEAAGNDVLPGVTSPSGQDWQAMLDDWATVCHGLGNDFRAGHAAVNPKRGPSTCQSTYCTLAPLCRIHTAVEGDSA